LDLDVQASHVCDHLDIEPRLQMQEIIENPDRLDAQLFDLFVSRHAASGIDVLATPRNKRAASELNMTALDALFRFISVRYDLVIVDLPPRWYDWTEQIISASDLVIITGFNTIPGLRRIVETIQALKGAELTPRQIVVALNRCEHSLARGIARRQHVKRTLPSQTVIYIREDAATANHSLNTGVPISMTSRSSKIAKDIGAMVSLVAELVPARAQVVASSNRILSG
jgi:pilus assembly protein CpaE